MRNSPALRVFGLAAAGMPWAFLIAAPSQTKPSDQAKAKVFYGRDVEPIFKAHCNSCHSGNASAGALDLSSAKGLAKGGGSGRAIVIGHPEQSILLQRIKGLDGKPQMPMGFPALSPSDIAKVSDWIQQGAAFESGGSLTHWAYIAPTRPTVPQNNSSWVRNPIDAFVLARLRKEGLHPAPEATKEILLRRVTLDLTGLPPTPAEMDAFLADHSPNAYEKVVDRLLASPHYGEQQARGWLDLARYADTDGYEKDLRRTAWVYRDWLVNAFNANMPYDQFTIKQLAGDLLPNATRSDLIATGFHRNTMLNLEGGVDQAEAHFAVVTDRVDTTATVWLGSTMACARCHNHKYDPFTQHDYYKMAAFFNNTVILPRGPKEVGEEKWYEPTIPAPSPSQEAEETRLKAEIRELDTVFRGPNPAVDAAFVRWQSADQAPHWSPLKPSQVRVTEGTPSVAADGSITIGGANPEKNTYTVSLPAADHPVSAIRLEVLPDDGLANHGPGRAENGNFVLTGFTVSANGTPFKEADARADYMQTRYRVDRLAEDDLNVGWAIAGGQGKAHELIFQTATPIPAGTPFEVRLDSGSRWDRHTIGKFRLSVTDSATPFDDLMPARIKSLRIAPHRTAAEEAELADYFRANAPELAEIRAKRQAVQGQLEALESMIPTALVLKEKPTTGPLTCYVRDRGEFLSKTDLVEAGTPSSLPPLKASEPNRLDLAKWIVDKRNPLTARVEVNRIWEQYFGRGIVETSEDFGTRGSAPSHPELLDWLATEFMAKGWSMKAIHRMIALSSTYRQSSDATATDMAKDPQNFLFARGPRFRLSAESIRDNALSAAGLLSLKMGGPGVFPYQPEGIWDSPYNGDRWMNSKGEDALRRSLYTFWKRTAPYPAFVSFDATSREACTVRRVRTNTPLQALTLLNDAEMMEAASGLGARMRKASSLDGARLAFGFRVCTGRKPTSAETARLSELLVKLRSRYGNDPKDTKALGGDAETAAWTMVGNVLLNLDETITKE